MIKNTSYVDADEELDMEVQDLINADEDLDTEVATEDTEVKTPTAKKLVRKEKLIDVKVKGQESIKNYASNMAVKTMIYTTRVGVPTIGTDDALWLAAAKTKNEDGSPKYPGLIYGYTEVGNKMVIDTKVCTRWMKDAFNDKIEKDGVKVE